MNHVEGDTALQTDVLEDVVEATHYRRWLAELALPYLGEDALEAGSGLGHYAEDRRRRRCRKVHGDRGEHSWKASMTDPFPASARATDLALKFEGGCPGPRGA